MNEQIRKLLNEATSGLEPDISPQRTVTLNEMEKFAELIIKECAKVCDDLDIDDWGDKSFDDGTYYCSRAIKKHFGVEE